MPNRTHAILRVKTGCLTCRSRKKKCDEEKPRCKGCTRNDLECLWPPEQERPSSSKVNRKRPASQALESESQYDVEEMNDGRIEAVVGGEDWTSLQGDDPFASLMQAQQQEPSPAALSNPPILVEDLGVGHDFVPDGDFQLQYAEHPPVQPSALSTFNPSASPRLDHESFELLSYYLARTANSMGNGSTDSNPFLTQLVPLAFGSELILHLILTQSANHRAVMGPESAQVVARNYYAKSLGLFRHAVNDLIFGSSVDELTLATGALIMCFTETTKGDRLGTIFDHLTAANSMLGNLMERRNSPVTKGLGDFLVEYYTYTATLSMISVDARGSEQLFLAADMEHKAQDLLESGYIGHLCGCWLELLLLIPRIFELGRQILVRRDQALPLSADHVMDFSELHTSVTSFVPSATSSAELFDAGHVFQKATLLYLLTVMKLAGLDSKGKHANAVAAAVSDAMFHLSQIGTISRVNTNLCWPLAVIGSCTDDESNQSSLRDRLQTMLRTISIGNMKETLNLLEHMWTLPLDQRSPWTICTTMQEHGLWISFA